MAVVTMNCCGDCGQGLWTVNMDCEYGQGLYTVNMDCEYGLLFSIVFWPNWKQLSDRLWGESECSNYTQQL